MNEKPIERLKYYNGQRLEAGDLKLEQEYHIRVRRWLNKSLYSAGIAEGLEVRPDLGNPQQVIVGPGLALDQEGREIILLDEQPAQVMGRPSTTAGEVAGNYLTIQYREETRAEESDSCAPRGNGRSQGQLAWGGPSRVRATPILGWSDVYPHESSGKLVLAQVELSEKCEVRHVYAYPRQYVGPTSLTTVRQFALEGERHIDANNPGRIYFHIRGRQPNAVTLYLRAEKFSTLYYTEMGKHSHTIHVSVSSVSIPAHFHTVPQSTTGAGTDHVHTISAIAADADTSIWRSVMDILALTNSLSLAPSLVGNAALTAAIVNFNAQLRSDPTRPMALTLSPIISFQDYNLKNRVDMTITVDPEAGTRHTHSIPGQTNNYPNNGNPTTYPLSGNGSSDTAGVTDPAEPAYSAHSGTPLTYVDHLRVSIGRADRTGVRQTSQIATTAILTQLKNLQPSVDWTDGRGNEALGNGASTHAFVEKGTGPIRLDLLPLNLSFSEGEYYVDLEVTSGGGRVLYNLYVE